MNRPPFSTEHIQQGHGKPNTIQPYFKPNRKLLESQNRKNKEKKKDFLGKRFLDNYQFIMLLIFDSELWVISISLPGW